MGVPQEIGVQTRELLFTKQDLLNCSMGLAQKQFPRLPQPGMLMLDRVVEIDHQSGRHGKGQIIAEFDLHPDNWFFKCHFVEDPIMPGSLGVDGLCQTLGLYLGWLGYQGKGRALGLGKTRYKGEVTPQNSTLTYFVDIRSVKDGEFPHAIADGLIHVNGETVTEVTGMSVGIKPVGT